MKHKKPEGITLFAIFLLLVGLAGMANLILIIILWPTFIGETMLLLMPYKYLIIASIIDIIGIMLVFISSYGLFKLKQWSRTLSIFTAVYLLISRTIGITIIFLRITNIMNLPGTPEIFKQIMSVYYRGLMIYSSIFLLALYVALIYYLSKKEIKQYF